MSSDYRTENFKLGQVHGVVPKESSREAQVRNYLYGVGNLISHKKSTDRLKIRLVGYEVPIWNRGNKRDECIDLIGYDQNYKPWLIELKKAKSKESLDEALAQISRYAEHFEEGIRGHVEREIGERFLWSAFRFSPGLGKMILADRKFFKDNGKTSNSHPDVTIASFAWITNEKTLLSKNANGEIQLKIKC